MRGLMPPLAIETRTHRWPSPKTFACPWPPTNTRTPGTRGTVDPTRYPPIHHPSWLILQLVLTQPPRTPLSEAKPSPAQPRRGIPYQATPISTRRPMGGHTSPTVKSKFLVFPSLTNYHHLTMTMFVHPACICFESLSLAIMKT